MGEGWVFGIQEEFESWRSGGCTAKEKLGLRSTRVWHQRIRAMTIFNSTAFPHKLQTWKAILPNVTNMYAQNVLMSTQQHCLLMLREDLQRLTQARGLSLNTPPLSLRLSSLEPHNFDKEPKS